MPETMTAEDSPEPPTPTENSTEPVSRRGPTRRPVVGALVALAVALVLVSAGLAYLYEGEVSSARALSGTDQAQSAQLSALAPYVVEQAAFAHWNAVAGRSVPTSTYLSNATLDWVGGPLAGSYSGASAIGTVWSHFAGQWSSLAVAASGPSVSVSPSGRSANASATLTFLASPSADPLVEQELVVSSTLTFENVAGNWLIQSEGWTLLSARAVSGPQAMVQAQAYLHWGAIAIENLSLLEPQYVSTAVVVWEGGPLNGTYSGAAAIQGLWTRFFTLWGAVWFYAETPATITVAANDSYAVVTAPIQFVVTPVANPGDVEVLNVTFTLDYQYVAGPGWQISHEVFQNTGHTVLVDLSAQVENAAFLHWDQVAIENASAVTSQYVPTATLDWVGGSLNGVYTGSARIDSAWNHFFTAWGAIWFYTETPPSVAVAANGSAATVTAPVQFVVTPAANPVDFELLTVNETLGMVYGAGGTGPTGWYISTETFQVRSLVNEGNQPQVVLSDAFAHWNDIAIENLSLLVGQYAPNATLNWTNGPIAGVYNYSEIINPNSSTSHSAPWARFFALWTAVWFYSESPPVVTISASQGYANVSATVQFVVTNNTTVLSDYRAINVTYYLDYVFDPAAGGWLIYHEFFGNTQTVALNKV